MKIASLFKNGRNQAVRLPKDFEFKGISEVEITKEGDAVVLRPSRKTWLSYADTEKVDDDFLSEREDVLEEGRVVL